MNWQRVLMLALLGAVVLSAAPHRYRLHTNQRAVITGIAEGPDGFLWLATTEGLQRFDGFHFRRIAGYPHPSAEAIVTAGDGSVWIGGASGLVQFQNQRFRTIRTERIDYIADGGDAIYFSTPSGVMKAAPDGAVRQALANPAARIASDGAGRVWSICAPALRPCVLNRDRASDDGGLPQLDSGIGLVTADGSGTLWAAASDSVRGYRQGRVVREIRRAPARLADSRALVAGRGGQIWYVGSHIEGLSPRLNFAEPPSHMQYPVSAAFEDSRGRLWVARKGIGLIEFTPDPDFERWYRADLDGDEPFQVVRNRAGELLAVTRSRIFGFDERSRTWSVRVPARHRYEFVLPLDDGGFLASTRTAGVVRLSPQGTVLERLAHPSSGPADYREILRDPRGRLWVGSKKGLYRIDGGPGAYQLVPQTLPALGGRPVQAVDLEIDAEGRVWAGYEAGLAYLDGEKWKRLEADSPLDRVRSFALDGEKIWAAHRHTDWFTRAKRSDGGWTTAALDSRRGWGPRDTHFLKRHSLGWIWRGSSDGVHITNGYQSAEGHMWVHINSSNGLALDSTDMYGFFEDRDGSVWVAGGGGISHIRPDSRWFDQPTAGPAPRITAIAVDGAEIETSGAQLPPLPVVNRSLEFEVGTLNGSPFHDQPVVYRLLPGDPVFQPAAGGSVQLRHLESGDYTLEVAYLHAESERPRVTAAYPFRVGNAGASWLGARLWWLLAAPAAIGLWTAIRRKPWMDRAAYWPSKAMFFLRRRMRNEPTGLTGRVRAGEVLSGRYRILEPISRGGFSVVYTAHDLQNPGTMVAVKIIQADGARDRGLRNRFVQEIASLQSIRHPGVVQILDWWVTPEGEPCLAMPFLEGPTLRTAMKAGGMTRTRAARIMRGLGAALAAVHARGIIHRDLKPENVILINPGSENEQAVVIDFGAAGLLVPKRESAVTTLLTGSFHYLAPERLVGKYSAASDIYSLGVIALELLAGKRLADLQALHSDPSFLAELEQAVGSRKVAEALAPAFDPEPSGRPPGAGQWAAEIAQMVG